MSDSFTIEPATRAGVKLLIGLFGMSSGGKTHSALALARGIVGPNGRLGVIDTENRRASYFADLPPGPACPGKFSVINLDPPFTPDRYLGAMRAFEDKADIVVVDSMTHEWSGEGGVIEMHEDALDRMTKGSDDYKTRAALNWPAWREPKMAHKALVMQFIRYKLPLICCLRGKIASRMVKVDGKNTVITDAFASPDYDDKFIFEMLLAGEVYRDPESGKSGLLRITKVSRQELTECLPKNGQQLAVAHGEQLARWCAGQSQGGAPASKAPDPRKALLADLRTLTISKHGWKKGDPAEAWPAAKKKLEQFLWDEGILTDTQFLDELPEAELAKAVEDTRKKLTPSTLL